MFEQDFERTRELLKSKMPDYLKSRGINPESKFTCANPLHHEHPLTMSYSSQDHCVHCFSCGASFDIFALIGIDHHLSDFASQFKKAHEMFIGRMPYQFGELLARQPSSAGAAPQGTIRFDGGSGIPSFEIEGGDFKPQAAQPFHAAPNDFEMSPSAPVSPRMAPNSYAGTDSQSSFNQSMSMPGSGLSFNSHSSNEPQQVNSGFNPFGPSQGAGPSMGGAGFFVRREDEFKPSYNYTEYFKKCRAAVQETDYFRSRGITEEVIERFGLGYDDHFQAGSDQMGSQILWRAAIIPLSDTAFMARNTSFSENDRIRKTGFHLFNIKALEQSGSIFVTEGEFDALSLESLGFHAIALGGTGNVRYFLEAVRRSSPEISHTFYICLDDDKAGQDAAKELALGLYQLQLPYKRIDLCFPYKDLNEALVKDPDMLKTRLKDLDRMLSYNLVMLPQQHQAQKLICSGEDLLKLQLGPALYTLCLRPHTARRLLAKIIAEHQANLVYAGNLAQWQYLSALVKRPQSTVQTQQDTSWMSARLLEIKTDDLAADIENGITACRVQGEDSFVTVADLTACTLDECLKITSRLGRMCGQLKTTLIALCNTDASRYVEAQALQNLDVTISNNGDFSCSTLDGEGKPLTFSLYNN